jgi:hypothetical protein
VLVAHLGLTTKGSIGAKTALTLDESAARVQAMHDAARAVRKDVIVICHGGPIAEPEDVAYVLAHTTGIDGFFGASSIERFATEVGIEEQARRFRNLALPNRSGRRAPGSAHRQSASVNRERETGNGQPAAGTRRSAAEAAPVARPTTKKAARTRR